MVTRILIGFLLLFLSVAHAAKPEIAQVNGLTAALAAIGPGPFLMANANGIATGNSAAANKAALQTLIDNNSIVGGTIYFTDPVPMAGGIVLKSNIKLLGNNFAALKGSAPAGGPPNALSALPSGAAFEITDTSNVFMTVQGGSVNIGIEGIIFDYPSQAYTATSSGSLITYPITIKQGSGFSSSMTFRNLMFVGNTQCFQFTDAAGNGDFVFDLIYAWPLGGRCIQITGCLDIPRITRCHVNPSVGPYRCGITSNGLPFTNQIIDFVASNGSPSFDLDTVDEFMMAENFVFGNRTGFRINNSYGTMVNCEADQVETGIHVTLSSSFPYKYLAVVSFNCFLGGGATVGNRNAIVFDGTGGKLFLTNVNGSSSTSSVVPTSSSPGGNSLVSVSGSGSQRLSIYGGRVKTAAGVYAKTVDQTNGSAIIAYSDLDQENVTSPSDGWQISGVSVGTVTTELPTKYVPVTIGGVAYKLLASP